MTQLRLPLGMPEARDAEFLVSEANARAVHQLDHWGAWPVMAALLTGPRKSGRSLLARVFAEKAGGEIIDNAELWAEADIFHAWNRAQATRHPLLIVADVPPPQWEIRLPDLRSRLMATPTLAIDPPDDALMGQLLWRFFDRRRLIPAPDLVPWLVSRVERSYVALVRVADALEDEAGSRGPARLSIQMAKPTLEMAGLLPRSEPEAVSETP
ncbi:P-loop NTPase family protein [Stakelama tenebrarum]|uniref:Chromosomal replication initiator DnaA n=1 Tax=Stakelama tenebrarum TaxID=2711215 RepID=A0A6G6Y6H3_9SPHN|nr:chromosomal replication initiator DnaA [Sphingosinithalassobacter tenebrarum]QIG80318.1 chromosomal replication initiator DnaA [Sphingosinithalassobacter tenebrarum]